ncbi:MAG: methyltransferase domain-containing protein [Candidatus Aegiribacteria sp.]|nr:methyltransferase domain-containing protein [Candidatus Aegiribacteria sp.]MBD3295170.1 methyltransferase domain-containing protein [Candidatus Fermentibacteria bacterium]
MSKKISQRKHWDDFWRRDRRLDEIYDNGGRILEEINRRMDVSGKIVMEVGAATARDSAALAAEGATAVALDYSPEALKLARKAAEDADAPLLLVCGDAFALPFREGSFDLVFHQGVLEHFREPLPLLKENVRVLREGGEVLVDVPQTCHVYTVIKKILIAMDAWFAGWETQFTPGGLSRLLKKAGFQPVYTYGRFFSPTLAYRIFRELLLKIGWKLPMYPVLVPSLHRLRGMLRKAVERSFLGPRLGCVIGTFAKKQSKKDDETPGS